MRVTNLMMTNNALFNLQKQEQRLNTVDQQYTTQKKISAPSEDPIVATRALKLNTTYSEINQYVSKNIPDAQNWMSMTQSALDNTQSVLKSIYDKCVQGNTDTLSDRDRNAIATSLSEMRDQIYQEGTSSYSGRFLFTGFKTDTNLEFEDDVKDQYIITESLDPASLSTESAIINQVDPTKRDTTGTDKMVPERKDFNRLRLAYDHTDAASVSGETVTNADNSTTTVPGTPTVKYTSNGTDYVNLPVTRSYATYDEFLKDAADSSYPGDSDVIYIAEKGELILGKTANDTLKGSKGFEVQYSKTGFSEGQLRPEHYFKCTRITDKDVSNLTRTYEYEKKDQQIKYLVSYNQQMTVNVQADSCYTHDMGRDVDELVDIVNGAIAAEDKMNTYSQKMNSAAEGTNEYKEYKELYNQSRIEYELRTKIMQESFAKNETGFQNYATNFSNRSTDVGSRQQRLTLIENRLTGQKADVEELQSDNIDVDLSEIIVRYTSALDVFNASLSATSKSITQTLLNYLS